MESLYYLDLIGTFVFAISGILAAIDRKFDLFGATILGLVTAVGGGTLRDILIGSTPVGWMLDIHYTLVVLTALPICYFFLPRILKLRKTFFLFDTIGIGIFTIIGIEKTLSLGLSPLIAIMMGVVSAVFGGVIRDILSNKVPLIFRKEIYAFACLCGGTIYYLLISIMGNNGLSISFSIMVVIVIRILAVQKSWNIPFVPKQKEGA